MTPKTSPDITRMPATIAEIKSLLTEAHDRERFAVELETAHLDDVPGVLDCWGSYAIGLYDPGFQKNMALIRAGRIDEIKTHTTEELFAMRGLECPPELRTPSRAERGLGDL